MLTLTLKRQSLSRACLGTSSKACIGTLFVNGVRQAATLERPWMDNQRNVSCIPPGKYGIIMTVSPRFGRPMMRLTGTDPRWGILIHAANRVEELQGCIALGRRVSVTSLIESRKHVEELEARVKAELASGGEVWIEITNPEVA